MNGLSRRKNDQRVEKLRKENARDLVLRALAPENEVEARKEADLDVLDQEIEKERETIQGNDRGSENGEEDHSKEEKKKTKCSSGDD